jgi:hypothetical protein
MSTQPERWSSYFDGDERVSICHSESEAIGEMECQIDSEYDPGEIVEYRVAQMVGGIELLCRRGAKHIGERLLEDFNGYLSDDMGAEEDPLDMTPDDVVKLGELVLSFIATNAKQQWFTVDEMTEQKRSYVAGSNDSEGGAT